jgi:hydrogenase-4 component F
LRLIAADHCSAPWLRAAFVLLLVGYGTKMGMAPMHTWKPDAYGETPGMVGALLSGGMTSVAFLALARVVAWAMRVAPRPVGESERLSQAGP